MKLTRYQVEMAVYAMYQAIELSKLVAHARVRPEVHDVLQELNDLLDVTCAREIESDTAAEELKSQNLIGSAKVAEILECTPQWVRQIRADLDGRRCVCGCGWTFDEETVLSYARERRRQ